MAKLQKAVSAYIKGRNSNNSGKCPHCNNGKIGNKNCNACQGTGQKR